MKSPPPGLGSHFPYLLEGTVHMSTQIHMQVMLPPHSSYGEMTNNQWMINVSLFMVSQIKKPCRTVT